MGQLQQQAQSAFDAASNALKNGQGQGNYGQLTQQILAGPPKSVELAVRSYLVLDHFLKRWKRHQKRFVLVVAIDPFVPANSILVKKWSRTR